MIEFSETYINISYRSSETMFSVAYRSSTLVSTSPFIKKADYEITPAETLRSSIIKVLYFSPSLQKTTDRRCLNKGGVLFKKIG